MTDYNYDAFSPDNYNLRSTDGPEIGDKAPDFELETHDGQAQRLLDFEGDCLVLELGSKTCPLFFTRQDSMEKFHKTSRAVLTPYFMCAKLIPVPKSQPTMTKWPFQTTTHTISPRG